MPDHQKLTRTRITGEIKRVRFENHENGFAVVTFRCSDGSEFAAKGYFGGLGDGRFIEADGYFEDHPEFGHQFRVESCRETAPVTTEGVERFLRFTIPGIGPKTAAAIVERFGEETVTILDLYPGRLREIKLIGKGKAEKIIAAWKRSRDRRDDMIFLQGLGITPAYCAKLFKKYGDNAAAQVRKNPYQMAEDIDGIGFMKADSVALSMGFAADSPARMTAAMVFALNEMIGEGNVCVPEKELIFSGMQLTGQNEASASAGLETAIDRGLLCRMDGCIYTIFTARAELQLPGYIVQLSGSRDFPGEKMRRVSPRSDLQLDPLQHQAVESLFSRPLNIITGGPGVGKTTVVGEIVRRGKAAKLKIFLAAPTGRAAKRMSESCSCAAKTIHRLLMFDPVDGKFKHNRSNPLECDLLIIDEVSMLDIMLANSLFSAIKPGTSVVLVGDSDQLPSVGPGTVLSDLMASGLFGVTMLTKIFRQSANSRIITNAHRVNRGYFPENPKTAPGELSDFYWIKEDDPAKAAQTIEILVKERIPVRFGFDPMNDIQVLSPMTRGECGTSSLNEKLSDLLLGDEKHLFQFGSSVYKQGDRVMQIENNYDKNVFNGDLGRIINIMNDEKKFFVCFDDERFVEYAFDEASQLTLAYAVTIHKSQGSEFPVVIIPVLTQHFVMLQRNLLYTGMTRAKKLLILVGSEKAVRTAVSNTRKKKRCSNLLMRLKKTLV